ncbi:MAG: PIN domain-containing protein [Lentisphaeria bacterium]|nr:PIN domain-containing protein [Lentisphaeria bacterium]
MTPTYLLDTSVLVLHALRGEGHAFVTDCLRKGASVCALTLFEFALVLRRQGVTTEHAGRVLATYRGQVQRVLPVDETVALQALELRERASARLPIADACIAACAVCHGLCLLHCDRHFAALPPDTRAQDIRSL